MISKTINLVLRNFVLSSRPTGLKRYGEGHIHETYLIETISHAPDYILQKINHHIFKDIPGMMRNIEYVTRHLQGKLAETKGGKPGMESLSLVKTINGNSFYQDADGQYWRMYRFISDTITHQKITHIEQASEAGRITGLFQSMLSDMASPLIETIPEFHDIDLRISQYRKAKADDPQGRAKMINSDLSFAEERFDRMSAYLNNLKASATRRVTHNDTKLNNILFNDEGKALCLVDLDTVMPGYVHFDYGDALRTMSNSTVEDERNISNVHFRKDVYHAFTDSYLNQVEALLTDEERKLLTYAPVYMTFIIGLRFLTDYLNGDVYYRVHYPVHNLVRARVQFKLLAEMEDFLNS